MRVEKNIMVPMRDGTRLATDLYVPDSPGRYPIIVERTPYNKENATMMWTGTHTYLVEKGYVVAVQDTRGRFASEGVWYPLRDDAWGERQDGRDTVEWLACHPACNGSIGSFGGSYSGNTQYLMAPTQPQGLKCMFVREGSSDLTEEWIYRGGAFELALNLHWGIQESISALSNRKDQLTAAIGDGIEQLFNFVPLHANPIYADPFAWLKDFMIHPPEDEAFWDSWNLTKHYHKIDVPILHFGSWYDIFIHGTLANFTGIAGGGATREARGSQRLFVGPWMHGPLVGESFMRRVGELDFGPEAVIDFNRLAERWFDCWLRGSENGVRSEAPTTIFKMGKNTWEQLQEWPPAHTQHLPFYLHSQRSGSACSLNDGMLSEERPPDSDPADTYTYDPFRPNPTIGGNTLYALPGSNEHLPAGFSEAERHMAELGLQAGPRDQRPAERQMLTFTTALLTNDVEVTGPIVARLYIASSAEDTDFATRLTDVWPDGRSILIADGILRARYRNGKRNPVPLVPGEVYPISIDLWSTSNVFKRGHRLRLSVASSNFPRYDRNFNIWKLRWNSEKPVVARNTIYHDRARPSCIILPISYPPPGEPV
jgi:putative CocE/NonD family hydrolase